MASGSGADAGYRRVVLVGFMGSGKSTVGTLLAARLGWVFRDFDAEIERRAGSSIEDIFRRQGEGAFRALESEVGHDLLRSERTVLATGGGWPVADGRMGALGSDTLSVWLDVSAETSLARIRGEEPVRPLLAVPDRLQRAERLLRERAPYYSQAELRLDTKASSPAQLVDRILEHLDAAARGEAGSR
jgi:shikimate kinase